MKILVVDDTDAILLLMTKFVEALGHQAVTACNGQEAVDIWRLERPDLILMDMLMPVMSGVDAAVIIKRDAGENWVPIIFVTGVGEEDTLADAIERGADDYLNKPVRFRVLEAKLKAFQRTLLLNRKVREQADRLADYYDRAEEEKRVVRHLMEQMVNVERLADPELEYWLSPAESLSGDLVAAARTPGKVLHVMLADGIGHGIAASLNVLPLTQPFYSMTEKGYGISDILREMNNKVRQVLPVGRFVAVALIAINEASRSIEIWNGGMPALQLLDDAGRVVDVCHSFSLPLGVTPSDAMEFMPERRYFDRRGAVLACSDGLLEARNREREHFGLQRLLDVVRGSPVGQRIDAARVAISDFLAGESHHDDISLVLASFGRGMSLVPRASAACAVNPAEIESSGQTVWRYGLMLGADELRHINVVPFMMSFVNRESSLADSRSDVFLILTELFLNALDYGVLNLDASIRQGAEGIECYLLERMRRLSGLQSGFVAVDLAGIAHEGRVLLSIRVKDSGRGFDWRRWMNGDLSAVAPSSGIALVRSLCLGVHYVGAGNEVLACYVPRNS